MGIRRGQSYRVKGNSPYFKNKYGTPNPVIEVEDTDTAVFGRSWSRMDGNPVALFFAFRAGSEGLDPRGTVWYGKIDGLGELVHEAELEEIPEEASV